MPSDCCGVDESERKVEFDHFDRYRACTGCNQLQPTTTPRDLPRKGLHSILTIASGVPRTPVNAMGCRGSEVQILGNTHLGSSPTPSLTIECTDAMVDDDNPTWWR